MFQIVKLLENSEHIKTDPRLNKKYEVAKQHYDLGRSNTMMTEIDDCLNLDANPDRQTL